MSDAGVADSAILLMSLGEEEAAQVFRYLGPREVQKIGQAMAKLAGVTRERIENVLSSFHQEASTQTSLGLDADGYIRNVLTRALGDDKASFLLDRILQGGDAKGIESLRWMDAPAVADLIRHEHPQVIASILVHLERDQASAILTRFPERTRNDVVLRIATLDAIQPSAMSELNDVLAKLLSGTEVRRHSAPGGVRTAAEILNFLGSAVETSVVDAMREVDAELAQKILDEMFVFENLLEVDDRGIQALLREIQSESLIVALKGANEELREKIFKNMSQRAAEMLRDDLEAKGPVRVSEVEAEQKEILKIVRRMAEEGTIVLGGKGDDQFV
ncbi:MAG: flagellar motor switch protein FliG [Burkholderiales bacterium]|nr:flagellar motor switch protein FliG [Burkholderiales bacterium]MCE7876091.1 flagellar motor switch protein FliG [Betaproteobacteria bacterium PRO3]